MSFEISVVIPCRKGDTTLVKCLQSLQLQKDCQFEVLVVINPPSENNTASTHNYPIRYFNCKKGTNTARNLGMNYAQSDLVLFLDSDCTLNDTHFLKKYVNYMNSNLRLTGCGGPYELPLTSDTISKVYHKIQLHWLYSGLINPHNSTQHLLGGNLVLRKSMLNSQIFDENIIFGGTEAEFLLRLTMQGHEFHLINNQIVSHISHVTLLNFFHKAYKQGQGKKYILNKFKFKKTEQKTYHLHYNQILKNSWILTAFYRLVFQIGQGVFLKNKLNYLNVLVMHLYYKTYFFLNLVKRSK